MALAFALAWFARAEPRAAGCDRGCLTGILDRYLAALVAHSPSGLPLASSVIYTENGTRVPIGSGLWKTATRITLRRELFVDADSGEAAFWGVLDEQGAPLMLSLRLKIVDERISEAEAVVARRGSHALFAPEAFAAESQVFGQTVARGARMSRAGLIAAANGYFDGLQQHDSRLVPSSAGCNRFENGTRMTNRPGAPATPRACAVAVDRLTYIKRVDNRRFVVDVERGAVLGTVMFDIPADPAATPPREARMLLLAEAFSVRGGQIERIETVMHNLPYGSESGWPAP